MKKIGLVLGIILVIVSCYVFSIYSFSLNETRVGSIELRKGGGERVVLSQVEVSNLVGEINDLKFKLGNKNLEIVEDEAGYKGPHQKFRIFVFDKNGKELADIRVYNEINISYVQEFDGSISLGYHATNGILDIEKLSVFSE